ncbi:MAG: hypothetical protein P4L16_05670 [Chlamydiales bacterium]|nr:hypothetical protein [Chlamydiales bacterium]
MQMLEKGKDKIQQICDLLRHETLEPAKEEAEGIISSAKEEAHQIVLQAQKKAEELVLAAKASIQKEREVFQSSLKEASKQSVEALRQKIEQELFNDCLFQHITKEMVDPNIIVKLITVIIEAIQKEGLSADFSALIPQKVSPESINALLKQDLLQRLKEKSVVVGGLAGGVELQLHDKQMKIVLSNKDVLTIVEKHLRKEFRQWLFKWQ